MAEEWTGRLVGRMHMEKVRYGDMGKVLGVTSSYVGMILSGDRTPPGAQEMLEKAFETVLEKRRGDTNGDTKV